MARGRILLADDSKLVRTVVARGLSGVPLVEAASLEDGLRIDPETLEGAVLDLDLGDGSGVALAEALRARAPGLPIAFFSDGQEPRDVSAFGPLFEKPAQLDELVAWVRALGKRD